MLLQSPSKLQKQEPRAQMDFVLEKLDILTNERVGEDPETGLIIEPITPEGESRSRR